MIIISFILYESILILSLYLGLYTIDNVGNYYILNQHKNATGMLLSIGFIITFLYSVFYKSRWTLLPVAVASTLILIVGCRAALLAILFSIALFIILRYIKFKELISYLGIVLILKLFTVVSLPQQIIDAQVNRFYKIVYLNRYISDSKTKKESEDKKITSASSRIVLWKQALELFKQKPLFGVGFGGFYIDVKGWLSKRDEPHNGVLQILSEGGIFSLLSFLGLLIFGLIKKEKSRLDIIIFITLVMYIFQDMFGILWISGDGHIFWFLFFIYAFTTNNPSSKDLIYVK
jgi:O-antigen ligase